MSITRKCQSCGDDMRPYDFTDEPTCFKCLKAEVERLQKELAALQARIDGADTAWISFYYDGTPADIYRSDDMPDWFKKEIEAKDGYEVVKVKILRAEESEE